jgi:hypothetical protein
MLYAGTGMISRGGARGGGDRLILERRAFDPLLV